MTSLIPRKDILSFRKASTTTSSAAVIKDGYLLSNVVSSQAVHEAYGGVVPELASRAHQQNIVPVVHEALKRAGVTKEELSAVAFTRGPGLMGSLLVGVSFAKGFARSLNIPMIDVNHLTGHVFAHYQELEKIGLAAPQVTYIMHDLKEKGLPVKVNVTTVKEATDEIMRALEKKI